MGFIRAAIDTWGIETARRLADIRDGQTEPEDYPAVAHWLSQCFNRPRDAELQLEAFNAILGGYGIEAIRVEDAWVDAFHGDIVASYVNMGDAYVATVVLDSETGEFVVASYGDWLESNERRFTNTEEGED